MCDFCRYLTEGCARRVIALLCGATAMLQLMHKCNACLKKILSGRLNNQVRYENCAKILRWAIVKVMIQASRLENASLVSMRPRACRT